MLEETAEEKRYLPVSYDRFEFSAGQGVAEINLQYHLRNIISRLLVSYLSHLADFPDLLTKLPADDRRRISVFVHSYLGNTTGTASKNFERNSRAYQNAFAISGEIKSAS